MDLKDFMEGINDEPSYIIERKLNELVRKNYHFQNLDEGNRELVLELVKKYREKIRKGIGLSQLVIDRDLYRLHQERLEKGLTLNDLKHIRAIAESFKRD
ncbi:MAG: hypothetical protein ACM3PZ_03580 [Bacillota bacterium]